MTQILTNHSETSNQEGRAISARPAATKEPSADPDLRYEEHQLVWADRLILVRWAPFWLSSFHDTGHLEVRSDDGDPLPITETGYRSHFLPREVIAAWSSPAAYVSDWLDVEADKPAWQERELALRQLSLF